MCCFGVRVFLLIFITVLSFAFHRLNSQIPVICYYLILASLLAFVIFSLFFKGLLPNFVKPAAVHYFSLIGGVVGSLLAMAVFRRFKRDGFCITELCLLAFWIVLAAIIFLNFDKISAFFQEFLL